jgi:hypothetical protein
MANFKFIFRFSFRDVEIIYIYKYKKLIHSFFFLDIKIYFKKFLSFLFVYIIFNFC